MQGTQVDVFQQELHQVDVFHNFAVLKVSPTLSNLTKLGSMCIPLHYAALFAATGDFPSVDGKTHYALNCGT